MNIDILVLERKAVAGDKYAQKMLAKEYGYIVSPIKLTKEEAQELFESINLDD
jgi:hypothetical protein